MVALTFSTCSGGGSNGGSGDSEIGLNWNAVGKVDRYRVYRSTSSGLGVSRSPLNTGVSSTGYTDETAKNGTKYFYVVTAVVSENGGSAESDPSSTAKYPYSRAT
jgi:fibronectin type 3 domain-containing protein